MNTEQIISWAIALAALTLAIVVVIKTPKKNWLKSKEDPKDQQQSWAPEYTWREKLTMMGKHAGWAIPLIIGFQYIINLTKAPSFLCGETWGILHWYGSILGMVLLMLLLFLGGMAFQWVYWQKVLRHEQYPLPGQKVWKPQKVISGAAALRKAKLFMGLSVALGFAFLVCMVTFFFLIQGMVNPEAMAAKCELVGNG